MDNIRKLQGQFRKPNVVCLIVMDAAMALLVAMFLVFDARGELLGRMREDSELFGSTLLLVTVVVVGNAAILRGLRSHPSVTNLPPEVRAAINEQCMTGMTCGNGILCEDGYLLVTDRELKVVGQGAITQIGEKKALFRGKYLYVVTRQGEFFLISPKGRRLRGNGTFRPVDVDTFRQELDKFVSGGSVCANGAGQPSGVLFQGTNVEIPRASFGRTNVETSPKDSGGEQGREGENEKNC